MALVLPWFVGISLEIMQVMLLLSMVLPPNVKGKNVIIVDFSYSETIS